MIQKIYIHNYKCMVNFTLSLGKQNIFLGANGTGKSSVFYVLYNLKRFITGEGRVFDCFDSSSITKWQKQNVQVFGLELSLDDNVYEYHLEIEHEISTGKSRVKNEWVKCNSNFIINANGSSAQLYNDRYEEKSEILMDWTFSVVGLMQERYENKKLIAFKKAIQKIIVCSPIPRFMHDQTKIESAVPEFDFNNIAAVFRHVVQEYPDCIMNLFEALKEVLPGFVRLHMQGDSEIDSEKTLKVDLEINNCDIILRFEELSDGEKMLIALYILAYCYLKNGYSVFLDEADNYIALSEIQPVLFAIEDSCKFDAQCAMISHNSNTIDYYGSDQIRWFYKSNDGIVKTTNQSIVGDEVYTASQILERGVLIAE